MKFNRREVLACLGSSAAGLAMPMAAWAQSWPSKPIKLVIGYSTGGSTDATARLVGRQLEQRLGQPMVFEYKPGAGASMGAEFVAKSVADGYTIGLTDTGPMAVVPHLRKLAYDPTKDFTPLSYVCATGLAVLVHPSVPANNIKELIALAKADPEKYNYASSGVGSVHHLAGELFKSQAGVKMAHVPYRGAGPALTDLVGGRLQMMFENLPTALPLINSGAIRAVAVTGPSRAASLPNVPTIGEDGLSSYVFTAWFTIAAPAGTPDDIVRKLNHDIREIMQAPDMQPRLAEMGVIPGNKDVSATNAFIAAETAKFGKVIKEAHIVAN